MFIRKMGFWSTIALIVAIVVLAGCDQPVDTNGGKGDELKYEVTVTFIPAPAQGSKELPPVYILTGVTGDNSLTVTVKNTGNMVLNDLRANLIASDEPEHETDWEVFCFDSEDNEEKELTFSLQPDEEKTFTILLNSEFTSPGWQYKASLRVPNGTSSNSNISRVTRELIFYVYDFIELDLSFEDFVMDSGLGPTAYTDHGSKEQNPWISTNQSVATVNPQTGAITPRAPGRTLIGFFSEVDNALYGSWFSVYRENVDTDELEMAIANARDLIKSANTSESGLYYFQHWVNYSALSAVLAEVEAKWADVFSMSQNEVNALTEKLTNAFDDTEVQPGPITPPDDTNVASRYLNYEVSSGSINNALSTSGTSRWSPTEATPSLELSFYFPVTLGGAGFSAYASSAGGDSGMREFKFEYLDEDGTTWKTAYHYPAGVNIPGDVAGPNNEQYFIQKYVFDEDISSTKFRLAVIQGVSNPSFRRVNFFTSTEGRKTLEKAIAGAKADIAATAVSVNGDDVNPADKWVTSADQGTYSTAITAAENVLSVKTTSKEDLQNAKAALDTAAGVFTAAKQDGKADTSFTDAKDVLLAFIDEMHEYLLRHGYQFASGIPHGQAPVVTAGASTKTGAAADYYPFEWAAPDAARTTFSAAITAARNAPKTNLTEVNAASDALGAEKTVFDDLRIVGTKPLPASGANIGHALAYGWGTDTHPALNFHAAMQNGTPKWLTANPNRWGTTGSPTWPIYANIVFSEKVPVSAVKIYVERAGSDADVIVKNFDIEYWDDTDNDWVVCFTKTDGLQIPGINADVLINWSGTREERTYLAVFTGGKVTSDRYRIVIRNAAKGDPSFWAFHFLYAP